MLLQVDKSTWINVNTITKIEYIENCRWVITAAGQVYNVKAEFFDAVKKLTRGKSNGKK